MYCLFILLFLYKIEQFVVLQIFTNVHNDILLSVTFFFYLFSMDFIRKGNSQTLEK